MRLPSRREFLKSSVRVACTAGLSGGALADSLAVNLPPETPLFPPTLPIKKGVWFAMLPATLSIADRLKMARDAGFEVVQVPTEPDEHKAEEIKKAAEAADVRIDSVMNMDHWKYPLSSNDREVVEKSLAGMRASLHNAKFWGADAVLLVPAVVNPQTSYRDAWTRSQKEIRTLLPLAEESKVIIAIEEVWNKFLLSPLEMAKYISEFQSPWIKAWFDVGNVLLYGGLDSHLGKQHRQGSRQGFQAQGRRIRVGQPGGRGRRLGRSATGLCRHRLFWQCRDGACGR